MFSGSATNIPVLGPVSIAMISSRSPLGPVITIVRRSMSVGSTLHDGAFARRYSGLPIKPHTVRRRKPGSMNPVISSKILPTEPLIAVVTSLTVKTPLAPPTTRKLVVLLEPFAAFEAALTRIRNTMRPPGSVVRVVVLVTAESPASRTPTID